MKAPRALLLAAVAAVLAIGGCGGGHGSSSTTTTTITVSGNAFAFPNYERLYDAQISVAELPGVTTTTGGDGYFEFDDFPAQQTASFVLTYQGYPVTQTKTFRIGATIERITFQVPDQPTVDAFAYVLGIHLDPAACQVVTTVTRVGKSIYDEGAHGEAGATATIDPPLSADHGPIYFGANVIPNPTLTQTSEDGGVVFTNVPPGEYDLHATKAGVEFSSPHIVCRAGVLVNASPPYGVQALQ